MHYFDFDKEIRIQNCLYRRIWFKKVISRMSCGTHHVSFKKIYKRFAEQLFLLKT